MQGSNVLLSIVSIRICAIVVWSRIQGPSMLTILSSSVFSEDWDWDCDMRPSCVWCHEMIQKKRKGKKRNGKKWSKEKWSKLKIKLNKTKKKTKQNKTKTNGII